jgi:hypothetical protein
MADITTHGAAGPPITPKDAILETGASATQSFAPLKATCAHLNAFHVYASDPSRTVEANHYCTHLSTDVRSCTSSSCLSSLWRLGKAEQYKRSNEVFICFRSGNALSMTCQRIQQGWSELSTWSRHVYTSSSRKKKENCGIPMTMRYVVLSPCLEELSN